MPSGRCLGIVGSMLEFLHTGVADARKLSENVHLDADSYRRYVDLLKGLNLVTEDVHGKHLVLTGKGREYLEHYRNLWRLIT